MSKIDNRKPIKGVLMRKIKIVSDSSSDLLTLERAEFASAPMKVVTKEREFSDDEALDVGEMVRFFDTYKGKSQTSCPNTADWLTAFGDADDIFCVTITSALSGSYNSACVAKQTYEAEHPDRRVFVIDTLSAGPEITMVVEKLEEYVAKGYSYEEICEKIACYQNRTGLIFMLKSLKNFANNGRVSPAIAKLIGFVGICIVGKASDEGTLAPMHKCRGENRALETLVSELEKMGVREGKVSIGHAVNEDAAHRLSDMIRAKFPGAKIEIHALRGLCSYYAEKGGLLVGFEKM